jgi:uncharacterized membrane protein YbhN (UPF0104 family)
MNRLLRRLLVAILLGVLVYLGFALYRGISQIGDRLAHFNWGYFALACALAFANYLLRFGKWEFYLARLQIRGVPKPDSLLIFLSGLVLTVTPGKVGEVFKSLVLQKIHGVPATRTGPIVIAERLTDVIGIVVLIVAGSAGFPGGLGWAAAGGALVVLGLIVIGSDRLSEALLGALARAPGRIGQTAPKIREAWDSLRTLTAASALVVPTLLSIVAWALEGLALWVILHGFGESTPLTIACFFYATSTLAGAIVPVPGGLGVTEGALEEQLTALGHVGHSTATSAMILVRFATLWFAVLVGFISLTLLRMRHPTLVGDDPAVPRTADPTATAGSATS